MVYYITGEQNRKFSFGKIDYNVNYRRPWQISRKINEVVIEVSLYQYNKKFKDVFTAHISILNMHKTDSIAAGQMFDDDKLSDFKDDILFQTISDLWRKYHLKSITKAKKKDKELIYMLLDETKTEEEIRKVLNG